MKSEREKVWSEANQEFLVDALRRVRDLLCRRCEQLGLDVPVDARRSERAAGCEIGADDRPPALVVLSRTFHLSSFEQQILLLCAGLELDSSFPPLCSRLQGGDRCPTFGLALSLFPDAHWTALSPAAPLRYWRLIEVDADRSLTAAPIRIDESILHYLTGVVHLDPRLWGTLKPWKPEGPLPASHQASAEVVAAACSNAGASPALLIQLSGADTRARRDVAALACERLSRDLYLVSAHSLPASPAELDGLVRLCGREAALTGAALLVELDETETPDPIRMSLVNRLIEQLSLVIVSAPTPRDYGMSSTMTFDVRRPTQSEQREMWEHTVEKGAVSPGWLDRLAGQFNLDSSTMRAAGAEALLRTNGNDAGVALDAALWDACRNQARVRLDELALRIEPAATWADLVLPRPELELLRNIAVHLRHRVRVYQDWGFAARSSRGLGITALFVGESGTGKTLAAEVLACDLRLDLYRIDLSQVVSKYIGETEKNLRRVFDAAERGAAILLFDEADALFGKRSEVKDSHDRYANIEVSYLLQRMEAYRGLAILTTNMRNALDPAFLRRLRFVVQFPFPDADYRAEIWRRVFPDRTPTENLDFVKLARLNVAGGNIRNIAMNAAFLAAECETGVRMSHVLAATRVEYAKLEKPLMDSEIGGWV